MAISITELEALLLKQKEKLNKMKKNDIPHLEADLKAAKAELAELVINVKYLSEFIRLYRALEQRELI